MKDLYLKHEEGLRIIELSDIDVRTRYKQYGYYGYNFKTKRLVQPTNMLEISIIRDRNDGSKLRTITMSNGVAIVVVNELKEVVYINMARNWMNHNYTSYTLRNLCFSYNLVIVSENRDDSLILYQAMRKHENQ